MLGCVYCLFSCLLSATCVIIISDASNFEEDSFVDETAEAAAKYIIDHLLASVTAPVGRCHTMIDINLMFFRAVVVSTLN